MDRPTPRRWNALRTAAVAAVATAALAVAASPASAERNEQACEAWSSFFDYTVNQLNNLQPGEYIGAPRLLANLARATEGVQEWC
jgi:hypothetical protein